MGLNIMKRTMIDHDASLNPRALLRLPAFCGLRTLRSIAAAAGLALAGTASGGAHADETPNLVAYGPDAAAGTAGLSRHRIAIRLPENGERFVVRLLDPAPGTRFDDVSAGDGADATRFALYPASAAASSNASEARTGSTECPRSSPCTSDTIRSDRNRTPEIARASFNASSNAVAWPPSDSGP